MKNSKLYFIVVLTFLVILLGFLSYRIIRPLMIPLSWAIVLSILFYPMFAFIDTHLKSRPAAAFLTLCIILLVIIVPVWYLVFLLADEVAAITSLIETGRIEALSELLDHPAARKVVGAMAAPVNMSEEELIQAINQNIFQIGREWLTRIARAIGSTIGGIIVSALGFILMSITLYFILRDAPAFMKQVRDYLPFSEDQKDSLVNRANDIVFSTMYGGIAVAVAQGIAGGTAFALLGIATPVMWGLVISIVSFLPVIGPGVIWIPAAVYFAVNGAVIKGALVVVAGIGIAAIDTFLRPIIIGNRTKMPFLIIFFSVIGGIQLFGLIGFILGPLVIALFISVLDVFVRVDQTSTPEKAA